MFKYTLKKLLAMIPKFLAITVFLFVLLEISPGDPLTRMVDPDTYADMTPHMMEEYRESLGLNRPAVIRYFSWLGGLLQGDFGYSMSARMPIADLVADRLPFSMELQFATLVLSGFIGVALGFLCAVFKRTPIDYLSSGISAFGISLPEYFWALGFMIIFGITLNWFPTGGRMPTDIENPTLWQRLPYMVLPVSAMVFHMFCSLTRQTRSTMIDVMNKDYIKTARSKGLPESVVNVKHCLRNSMTPIMTMLVMRLPRLIGGSIVIEQVFNYIGIGAMTVAASQNLDTPVVLFNITLTATMTLVASTLIDILTAALDPRVRFE